ncbi:MAG: hypothetical protein MI794_17630, partial [Pseudomonadales bacterium]|nr:hypothetical protein [Pseudomonadales bacterium]
MKISHFFAVLVRLFAIGLAIYAVRQLLLVFEVMATGGISGYDVSAVFAGMLVLCGSSLLLVGNPLFSYRFWSLLSHPINATDGDYRWINAPFTNRFLGSPR